MIRYPDGSLRFLTQGPATAAAAGRTRSPCASRACTGAGRRRSSRWSSARRRSSTRSGPTTGRSTRSAGSARARPRRSARSRTSRPATTTSRRSTRPTVASSSPPTARRPARAHHYPQLDEYESAPTVAGHLVARRGERGAHAARALAEGRLLALARLVRPRDLHQVGPSAARSAGRRRARSTYGAFNYATERAPRRWPTTPRSSPSRAASRPGATAHGHTINVFFPWQMNEDGTGLETLESPRPPRAGALLRLGPRRPAGVHRATDARRPACCSCARIRASPAFRHHGPEFATHAAGRHHRPSRARGRVNADALTRSTTSRRR